MRLLKNSLSILVLCWQITGCQSHQVYEIKTFSMDGSELHIINVSSDRISQKCLFFNAEAENNWRHQYFLYILNDKNEVLEAMQSTNTDKETCHLQLTKVKKILESTPQVRLCIRDDLKTSRHKAQDPAESIQFGELGQHRVVYEMLTFDSICGSKKCLSDNAAWINTFPGFPREEAH